MILPPQAAPVFIPLNEVVVRVGTDAVCVNSIVFKAVFKRNTLLLMLVTLPLNLMEGNFVLTNASAPIEFISLFIVIFSKLVQPSKG